MEKYILMFAFSVIFSTIKKYLVVLNTGSVA